MTQTMRNVRTIIGRELYSYFASPIAYVFLIMFLGISGLFTFELGHFFRANVASLKGSFFLWHPWLYMVFVPAVGMRLWSEERRSGSLELLFTLPTTVGQAVVAKFLAGSIFLGLSLLLTFPVVLTVSYLGDPDNGMIICGYIGSFLAALSFLALSSFTSALTRNQIVSFILSLVVCLFLILCGFPPVINLLLGWGAPGWFLDLVSGLSTITHFDAMQRGVIDSRDVIYFASLIVFGLFGTTAVLKSN